MQRPRSLVAVHVGDLGEPDRQIAVTALLRGVDEDVHRAIHRLHPIAHGFRLSFPRGHGWELVRRIEREVSRAQEQLLAGHVGRVDQRIATLQDRGYSLVYTPNVTREELRSEEHTSELQSHSDLVCRLLLEKKKR